MDKVEKIHLQLLLPRYTSPPKPNEIKLIGTLGQKTILVAPARTDTRTDTWRETRTDTGRGTWRDKWKNIEKDTHMEMMLRG